MSNASAILNFAIDATTSKQFTDNYIPFNVYHAPNTKLTWFSEFGLSTYGLNPSDYVDKFSYVTPNCPAFEDIKIDFNEKQTFLAERYGGMAAGFNGGGVRCGNTEQFQVKGIGINCTIGISDEDAHGNGIYSAIEATVESIASECLSKYLPGGVVRMIAMLSLGSSVHSEIEWQEPIALSLAIREICIRPAHFLPAMKYTPPPSYAKKMLPDRFRSRNINKQLRKVFNYDDTAYVQFLGEFLSSCAKQFAFGWVHRICHGAPTDSNLSIDGRWLDLTNFGYLPIAYNASESPISFYSEKHAPPDIVADLILAYNKFNNTRLLNIAPLQTHYDKALLRYMQWYSFHLVGLPSNALRLPNGIAASNKLLATYDQFMSSNSRLQKGFLRHPEVDEYGIKLVRKLFSGVLSNDCSDPINEVIKNYASTHAIKSNKHEYFCNLLLRALKPHVLGGIFFNGFIKDTIGQQLQNTSLLSAKTIDNFSDIFDWVMETTALEDSVMLWKSESLELSYLPQGKFLVDESGDISTIPASQLSILVDLVGRLDKKHFLLHNYNFHRNVHYLVCTVYDLLKASDEQR